MTIAELTAEMNEFDKAYRSEECRAFQRLLEMDLRSLDRLQQIEQECRQEVRGGAPFDFGFDQEITRQYGKWVESARSRLKQLRIEEEEKDCHPESADAFRQRLEDVEEYLLERIQDEQSALATLQDLK